MTTAKIKQSHSKKKLLMLAGACGILEVIVIMVSVSLAILYSPGFNLTQNWVSDLTGVGYTYFENVARPVVSSPVTEILARSGFIIGGILGIVFSFGLFYDDDAPSHRLGGGVRVTGSSSVLHIRHISRVVWPHTLRGRLCFVLNGPYRYTPYRGCIQ